MSNDGQLTFEDDPIFQQFQSTFELIKKGEFRKAYEIYEDISQKALDLPDIFPMMKCLKFWLNREEQYEQLNEGVERGDFLSAEWIKFEAFLTRLSLGKIKNFNLLKEAVYNRIIDNYISQFQKIEISDVDLLVRISEALLVNRQYLKAKDTLLYAMKFRQKDARIHAFLGEAYYFLNDVSRALLHYREAFFYGPADIDLSKLTSPVITTLIKQTSDNGFINQEINLWLPVFAEINGAFYVKKELNDKEFERIQKKTYEIEIKYEINQRQRGEIEPVLINHYIFLLNHHKSGKNEDRDNQVANLLRKIKNINETVYTKLRKSYG